MEYRFKRFVLWHICMGRHESHCGAPECHLTFPIICFAVGDQLPDPYGCNRASGGYYGIPVLF